MNNKTYKEFELIGSSFECDKNCPYCTAKITRWSLGDNKFEKLEEKLQTLKDAEIRFRYFIFSGNGEPSLNSFEDLETVYKAVKKVDIFEERRFQTSGNIFFEENNKKFNLFNDDYVFEITRVSLDSKEDMKILGYKRDYLNTKNFYNANLRLNYVLLRSKKMDMLLDDIEKYCKIFSNITSISLKTLNMNTLNNNYDNPYSEWIKQNGYTKDDSDEIINYMNSILPCVKKDEEFFDRYEWKYKNINITFYSKKLNYGLSHMVFYCGEVTDYKLNKF